MSDGTVKPQRTFSQECSLPTAGQGALLSTRMKMSWEWEPRRTTVQGGANREEAQAAAKLVSVDVGNSEIDPLSNAGSKSPEGSTC